MPKQLKIGTCVAPGIYYQGENSYAIKVSTGKRKTNGNYEIHTETFHGSEREAIIRRAKLITEVAEGRLKPAEKKKTFGEYIEAYHEHNKIRVELGKIEDSTARYYKESLKLFAALDQIPVARVTSKHVIGVLLEIKRHNSTDYTLSVWHAFRAAWRASKLLKIPVPDILDDVAAVMPSPVKQKRETLTPEQIGKLLDAAKDDVILHGQLIALITTAGRLREVLALCESDINEEKREIEISNQVNRHKERQEDPFKKHKTYKSAGVRRIRMTEVFAQELDALRLEKKKMKLRAGEAWQDKHGLLFPTAIGTPFNADRWRTDKYYPLFDKAGVPRFNPHGLRHSTATFLLDAGEAPQVVMEICGHTEIGTTVDIYGHMRVKAQDGAMRRLDEALGRK